MTDAPFVYVPSLGDESAGTYWPEPTAYEQRVKAQGDLLLHLVCAAPMPWNGPVCPKHGPHLNYCAGCSDAADAERLPTVWSQDRARSELRVVEMLDEDGSWKE